jgi:glycosyltransferase involved in cell wall biosynthesis
MNTPLATDATAPGRIDTAGGRPLRVVFCWSEVPGYITACWQALARRPGIEVHVLHPQRLLENIKNPFELEPLMAGLSHEMFAGDRPNLERWLIDAVVARRPDVVVHCGWIFWPYTALASAPELAGVTMVLGMDSPWRGTLRQRVARLRLSRFINRMSLVVTSGDRAAEYARRLGVPDRLIHSGYYGFDDRQLDSVSAARNQGAWPRQFLFVGRYVDQKDLPLLIEAYKAYRAQVSNPWGLTCCGEGPDAHYLHGVEGVVDRGFTQPSLLPAVFEQHGAFVMASHFEPWGVVIAEAAASGLPVVCTSACGAGLDIVRSYYNGVITAPRDVAGLTRALRWIHDHESELAIMGARGRGMARGYSADAWAVRWHNYLLEALAR